MQEGNSSHITYGHRKADTYTLTGKGHAEHTTDESEAGKDGCGPHAPLCFTITVRPCPGSCIPHSSAP